MANSKKEEEEQAKRDTVMIIEIASSNRYLHGISQEQKTTFELIIFELLLNKEIQAKDETIVRLLIFLFKVDISLLHIIILCIGRDGSICLLAPIKVEKEVISYHFSIEQKDEKIITKFSIKNPFEPTIPKYKKYVLEKIVNLCIVKRESSLKSIS